MGLYRYRYDVLFSSIADNILGHNHNCNSQEGSDLCHRAKLAHLDLHLRDRLIRWDLSKTLDEVLKATLENHPVPFHMCADFQVFGFLFR